MVRQQAPGKGFRDRKNVFLKFSQKEMIIVIAFKQLLVTDGPIENMIGAIWQKIGVVRWHTRKIHKRFYKTYKVLKTL